MVIVLYTYSNSRLFLKLSNWCEEYGMKLKNFYKKREDIPEGMEQYYEEGDDGYILSTDDKELKDKLSEFRSNNRSLFSKNEELEKKLKGLEGLDPAKYDEALKALDELEDLREKKMIEEGKMDEVLAERTEKMRATYEGKIEGMQRKLEQVTETGSKATIRLNDTLVDSAVHQAISNVGVLRKGAVFDVVHRAKGTWKLDDEQNLVPMKDEKVMYGKDGDNQLTMEEWARDLLEDAPYLFESSKGAGSRGNQGIQNGLKVVQLGDQAAFNSNLEAIAKGEVKVVQS